MSFVLHTLLPRAAPAISPDALRAMLNARFGQGPTFISRMEEMPFTKEKSVRAEWGGYSIILTYDEGEAVKNDSEEIKRRLGDAAPAGIELIDRRIHVFFADDQNREHTTPQVNTMKFLEDIPGAIVYDPQQNKILSGSS